MTRAWSGRSRFCRGPQEMMDGQLGKATLIGELKAYKQEVREADEKNAQLRRQSRGIAAQLETYKQRANEAEEEIAQRASEADEIIAQLRMQSGGIAAELEVYKQRATEADEIIAQLWMQCGDVAAERDSFRRKVEEPDDVVVERDRLRQTVEELHRQHDGVVVERDRLQQTVQELRSKYTVERGRLGQQTVAGLQSEVTESESHSQYAPNLKRNLGGANAGELGLRKRLAISDGFSASSVPLARRLIPLQCNNNGATVSGY
ncbi:hypothetical protein B0H12DRAFT_775371 [Mycena haematopus]|nr:hypothetical protein B0H12DRAFT_775371 [Mycena haematopus]